MKKLCITTDLTLEEPLKIMGQLCSNVKDTKDDLCQNDESIFLRSFKANIGSNTVYDTCTCHGVNTIHWLVSVGYKSLVTDMSLPISGNLVAYQGLPPRERILLK